MNGTAILGLVAGLAVATLLLLYHGLRSIWHSALDLGLGGFVVVVAIHLGLIALMGTGWWVLGRGRPDAILTRFIWGRLIRDSASEVLPLSQVGGFILGARALSLSGVSGVFAAASTVVDVTTELVAQLGYTILGLALLQRLRPDNHMAFPVLIGVVLMGGAIAMFFAVQARGAGFVERIALRLAHRFLGQDIGEAGAVQAGISQLHARPGAIGLAIATHLASWLLNGVETWITLRLMGMDLTLPAALTIDSLLYGVRSVAFMVPNALGVQEGGLMVLGGMFGVPPSTALALSLVKRARDLALGAPALLAWQAGEGRLGWRKAKPPTLPGVSGLDILPSGKVESGEG